MPRKVLIVEDNRDQAETLKALLQLQGHEAQTQFDAQDIVGRVRAFDPDTVILDINLPGKNGFEAAKEIRAAVPGGRPTLIALTAYYAKEDGAVASKIAGFDYFLAKPADPKILLELIGSS